MEIIYNKLKLAGAGAAIGDEPSSPSGMSFDDTRIIQEDEFIRGAHPEFKDRENLRTTFSFTVTREHESIAAAQIFCLTHRENLPGVGDLILRGSGAGASFQRVAKNAALAAIRHSEMGIETTHTYQFMVGELVKTTINPQAA